MPLPTPFHDRTAALCRSLAWKEWAGYHAVCHYEHGHEAEYHAVRHAAGLLDVSPLYKLEVRGPDATAFLSWVSARDVGRLAPGRVGYSCWCDERGRVLDDGTITCFDARRYRVTSADPSWAWLRRQAAGFDVTLEDVSAELGALALQGPQSRAILQECMDGGDVASLGFFRATSGAIAGVPVDVTRTGYTGDLGYEVWVPREGALAVYDALGEAGAPRGLLPLGLDALDVLRIEAGFILLGVDYFSARTCLIHEQTSSPYELGLGWTVQLKRDPFLGQEALRRDEREGVPWAFVGLQLDWVELEALYDAWGLPPHWPAGASRAAAPLYVGRKQVGQATSSTFSPLLKDLIALASVRSEHATPGTRLQLEVTVEYERKTLTATVVPLPFFDPERKRS